MTLLDNTGLLRIVGVVPGAVSPERPRDRGGRRPKRALPEPSVTNRPWVTSTTEIACLHAGGGAGAALSALGTVEPTGRVRHRHGDTAWHGCLHGNAVEKLYSLRGMEPRLPGMRVLSL